MNFILCQFNFFKKGFKFVIGLTWASIKANEFAKLSPYSYFECNALLKIILINLKGSVFL